MKHAYLIIAHNNFNHIKLLVETLLTDSQNDVYIHIDAKVKNIPQWLMNINPGGVIPTRIDVRWADCSQIETEMALFRYAYDHGPYEYYHLISGIDLPIKPMCEIRKFFENNSGKEFVGYTNLYHIQEICKYHFFTKHLRRKYFLSKAFWKIVRCCVDFVANLFMKREPDIMEIKRGYNWVSITNDCCAYLLSKEEYITRRYRHTLCCDEVYKHTLIWNSPFKEKLYNVDDPCIGSAREIDWNRGIPYTWGQSPEDFEILMNSPCMFARKFDENKSKELIEKIVAKIRTNV